MKLVRLEKILGCTTLGYRDPKWPVRGEEKIVVHLATGIKRRRYFVTDDGKEIYLPVNKLGEVGGLIKRGFRMVIKSRRG